MARDERRVGERHAALGPTVVRLCEAVACQDVLAIVTSETRGEAIARAAAVLTDALVLWCPSPDSLPGEDAPASLAIAGLRVAALSALHNRGGRRVLLVTDASAAARTVAPPEAFEASPLILAVGDAIDREALAGQLEAIGFERDDRVDEPGEFADRAATIDIYPADAAGPLRIHLDEGRIDEIVRYDSLSQLRTGETLDRIAICPAVEPQGRSNSSLFDHLAGAAVALDPEAEERRDRVVELAREAGGKAGLVSDWTPHLAGRERISLAAGDEQPSPRFVEARNPERAFRKAFDEARAAGKRVLIAGSARDIRFVSRRIEQRSDAAPQPIALWSEVRAAAPSAVLTTTAELERGWTDDDLLVIAAADILGARAADTRASAIVDPLGGEITDFQLGDAIIHEDHGLGLLRGIEPVAAGEVTSDAVRLEYGGDTQRLVPVEEADRLWRYGAEAEAVTLDKLDGSSWQKRRAEIDRTIADTARQLIALAEERAARSAPVLEPPVSDYERFAATFPFTETPDQLRAIEAVRTDLASGKPMDRLVVGDVGYGKTEVALRAAAIAALCGKQVALVAPTTVLVRQHLESFRKRFERFGIPVAGLSRLSSAAEARAAKQGLADGSVRIVIGTKAIAGKGVAFQELGLVIIDEEQRFGTADKRKLRDLGASVHVLTLTATPIPRTLQGAMVGLQELSLITTPPARRLPTRTRVTGFSAELVRPALLREKRRGGQSFVVVPRIDDMAAMAEHLARLVPELKLRQAHGKMPAAEIDEEMIGFSSGDGDVLLATNIIEAGLDIPRANTMLIWRADRFGLAQLHQLRGRVGRGRQRGALLLLTEADAEIAPATLKRLRTMEALDQLGAGFAISARDLDLRGAGELLGEEQAGHVKLIGLGLYQRLLEQALRAARGEQVDDWTPELNLGLSCRLPADWIPEDQIRINLYARIARLLAPDEIDDLAAELEDRFGPLPPPAQDLLSLAQLRLLSRSARIARIDAGPGAIALTPRPDFAAHADDLEQKGERLLLKERIEDSRERIDRLRTLLEALLPEE